MPTDTDAHWLTFAARMSKIPAALDSYVESLRAAAATGMVSPKRQVEACAAQCAQLAAEDGYFLNLLSSNQLSSNPLSDGAGGGVRRIE